MTMMRDVTVLQAEVTALRAEIRRLSAPPIPALSYYSEASDMVAKIRERGVHVTEAEAVVAMLARLDIENDDLTRELRELQTFRANSDAEELADAKEDLQQARNRVEDLEIQLHDLRRLKK